MIASPDSSRSASSLTVLSVISPAGTITQTARGCVELGDEVVERVGAGGALAGERGDRVRVDVVDDALVAVAHQAAHDVRAHPSESDHPELHRHRILSAVRQATSLRIECRAEADILVIFGITGDLAQEDDLPGALPARAPRRSQLPPDHRRRAQRLERRRARRARARGDRGDRRRPRRGGDRAPRRAGSTYVAGDFDEDDLVQRSSPRRWAPPSRPVFYLEIPPSLFAARRQGPPRAPG